MDTVIFLGNFEFHIKAPWGYLLSIIENFFCGRTDEQTDEGTEN
jgi:hypothetical protein